MVRCAGTLGDRASPEVCSASSDHSIVLRVLYKDERSSTSFIVRLEPWDGAMCGDVGGSSIARTAGTASGIGGDSFTHLLLVPAGFFFRKNKASDRVQCFFLMILGTLGRGGHTLNNSTEDCVSVGLWKNSVMSHSALICLQGCAGVDVTPPSGFDV
uniref:Uncharacterized protein n=1 Tax=Ascaris lumbricoides TaxID=6252 RepID=A0A0M3IPP4_ASCLU